VYKLSLLSPATDRVKSSLFGYGAKIAWSKGTTTKNLDSVTKMMDLVKEGSTKGKQTGDDRGFMDAFVSSVLKSRALIELFSCQEKKLRV
jgi:hypothetical protein